MPSRRINSQLAAAMAKLEENMAKFVAASAAANAQLANNTAFLVTEFAKYNEVMAKLVTAIRNTKQLPQEPSTTDVATLAEPDPKTPVTNPIPSLPPTPPHLPSQNTYGTPVINPPPPPPQQSYGIPALPTIPPKPLMKLPAPPPKPPMKLPAPPPKPPTTLPLRNLEKFQPDPSHYPNALRFLLSNYTASTKSDPKPPPEPPDGTPTLRTRSFLRGEVLIRAWSRSKVKVQLHKLRVQPYMHSRVI